MKTYIISGAALLMSVLAPLGHSTTIILSFDGAANGVTSGIQCTEPPAASCIVLGPTKGAELNPPGSNPQYMATLISFGNIQLDEVTVSGAANAALNTTYALSGSDFTYSGTTLTDSGTVTSPSLVGDTIMVSDATPTVVSTVDSGFTEAPVYFAGGTVSVTGSLLAALGITGSYTATLGSDSGCNYPEGARDPQSGPGTFAGGCAAGFGNGGTVFGAESQYLDVVITTTTTSSPEPTSSLLLGLGLVAVGSLARKRRQSI